VFIEGGAMKGILLRWAMNSLAIFMVAHIIRGIEVTNPFVVIVVAFVLGFLNAFLRPLLLLITLPLNILTLGLFTFFINGFIFYLVSKIVKGFTITGFWPAFFGALIFSVISFFLNLFINKDGRISITIR
jgi:putative membrane protein